MQSDRPSGTIHTVRQSTKFSAWTRIDRRGQSRLSIRAQCSWPRPGSTVGTMPNRPLMSVFTPPTLYQVMDRPPGLIAQRRNSILNFCNRPPGSICFMQSLKIRWKILKIQSFVIIYNCVTLNLCTNAICYIDTTKQLSILWQQVI